MMVVIRYVKEMVGHCQIPGLGPAALGSSRMPPAESLPQGMWACTWPLCPAVPTDGVSPFQTRLGPCQNHPRERCPLKSESRHTKQ